MKIFLNWKFRAAAIAATMVLAAPALASAITMHRNPNCGCCEKWAEAVHAALGRSVAIVDEADMPALKAKLKVPADLASCHTAMIDGYVVEGHVPPADIARLLSKKPRNVRGLAVAGMPLGSAGMEVGDEREPYEVVAFGPSGRTVFARYR